MHIHIEFRVPRQREQQILSLYVIDNDRIGFRFRGDFRRRKRNGAANR